MSGVTTLVIEHLFEYDGAMISTSPEPAAGALLAAVDALEVAVEHLIKIVDDGALVDLGAFGIVETLRSLERVRNKIPVVDRAIIQHGTEQGAPAALSERTMTGVLMKGLRLSAGEASRRVRAAEQLARRRSQLGEPLEPIRPQLSAAQRDGAVTPEQVSLIDGALRKVKHCAAADVEAGEVLLVDQAARLGYQDLHLVAVKLVDAIDPDGALPSDEAEHRLRRFLNLRHRNDGSWVGDFRLTPHAGQKLAALLGPLTAPQTTRIDPAADHPSDGGQAPSAHLIPDERTLAQRRHDALEAVLDAALRSSGRPETQNGTPATVILTLTWQEFADAQGVGSYADGTPVSARVARDIAAYADIAFCLKDAKGATLDLWRTRRIASTAQTLALIARDGGCSFPGCDVAPSWCERHHVIAWWDGGSTNLGNLTLVCAYHHRQFAKRGWQCVITSDGLPAWIPPRWIDPQQRPMLNHRITLNRWSPGQPLDLTGGLFDDEPPDPPTPPG